MGGSLSRAPEFPKGARTPEIFIPLQLNPERSY